MVGEKELMVQREQVGVRGLLLLASAVAALVVAGFIFVQRWEAVPDGTIGYRDDDGEAWVNARGEAVNAPLA